MMKRLGLVIAALGLSVVAMQLEACKARTDEGRPDGKFHYSVEKIWDKGTHAAFTSLVKFEDQYYCTFREGYSHVFDENGNAEGRIRVLASKDGKEWNSVLDQGIEGVDCRDPKLCVTHD